MIQDLTNNDTFDPEIQEYLTLKSKTSRYGYSSAFKHFLDFYWNKYGKTKTVSSFLDRVFDEFKKERRKQKHVAELEFVVGGFYFHFRQKGSFIIRRESG